MKEMKHEDDECRPLVLQIRRFRQWYRARSLTQDELAELAGITRRQLQDLENTKTLQRSIETLVRIALALEQPIDQLLEAELLAGYREDINSRRAKFELFPPSMRPSPSSI